MLTERGPWRGIDDVEFATMTYVDWFNHRRLHGEITDDASYTTPAESEAAYYSQSSTALEMGALQLRHTTRRADLSSCESPLELDGRWEVPRVLRMVAWVRTRPGQPAALAA